MYFFDAKKKKIIFISILLFGIIVPKKLISRNKLL